MSRCVVGFSSIPPRFKALNSTIESFLNQTRVPDQIYIYIANYYPRFDVTIDKNHEIFTQLEQYSPQVKIVHDRDYGPISKLFCSLMNEDDDDTIICTADDDMAYGKQWLERLEYHSLRLPECAVGLRGRIMHPKNYNYSATKCIFAKGLDRDVEIDIITAVRGWAYRRKFFHKNFITEWEETEKKHPFIFFNDDIWISGKMEQENRKKMIVPEDKAGSSNKRLHSSSLIKSDGQSAKTNKHIQLFKEYWKPKQRKK